MKRHLLSIIYAFVLVFAVRHAFKRFRYAKFHPFNMYGIKQTCLGIQYKGKHYVVKDACVFECYSHEVADLVDYLTGKMSYIFSLPDLNLYRVGYCRVVWYLFLNLGHYTPCTLDTLPFSDETANEIRTAAQSFLKHRKEGIWVAK